MYTQRKPSVECKEDTNSPVEAVEKNDMGKKVGGRISAAMSSDETTTSRDAVSYMNVGVF